MSFHPNDVARRGARRDRAALVVLFVLLLGAFFRTQVLQNTQVRAAVARPTGCARFRCPRRAASSTTGTAKSSPRTSSATRCRCWRRRADTLRAVLQRLTGTIHAQRRRRSKLAVRRYRRAPNRPTVDPRRRVVRRRVGARGAPHRVSGADHPVRAEALLSRRAGRRVVRRLHRRDHARPSSRSRAYRGYKAGQQVGKSGLEKAVRGRAARQGRHAVRRGRRARPRGARGRRARRTSLPERAPPLYTNIDLDLQRYIGGIVRRLAAGRRDRDRSEDRRRARAVQRADASIRIGSSAAFPPTYWRVAATPIRAARSTTR